MGNAGILIAKKESPGEGTAPLFELLLRDVGRIGQRSCDWVLLLSDHDEFSGMVGTNA
jgi:hypothetical protein